MKKTRDNWVLITASALFLIYFANVLVGAFGGKAFLPDVTEMLTLFASCIFFVMFILHREKAATATNAQN